MIIGLTTPMSPIFDKDTGMLKGMKFNSPSKEEKAKIVNLKVKDVDAIIGEMANDMIQRGLLRHHPTRQH